MSEYRLFPVEGTESHSEALGVKEADGVFTVVKLQEWVGFLPEYGDITLRTYTNEADAHNAALLLWEKIKDRPQSIPLGPVVRVPRPAR